MKNQTLTLHASQVAPANAILSAIRAGQREVVLSGPAGTGKTTVLKWLVPQLGDDVAVVAPTNQAAKVLRSKGLDATTVHKTFYVVERVKVEDKPGRTVVQVAADKYLRRFKRTVPDGKRGYARVIVVDEASMVQTQNIEDLRRMCRVLVLVGDNAQLPPVNDARMPEGYFNSQTPTASLTEVLRQDSDSPVLAVATAIRNSQLDVDSVQMLDYFAPTKTCPAGLLATIDQYEADGTTWRVVAGRNATVAKVNIAIRNHFAKAEHFEPQAGEPMMACGSFSEDVVNGTRLVVFDSSSFPTVEELRDALARFTPASKRNGTDSNCGLSDAVLRALTEPLVTFTLPEFDGLVLVSVPMSTADYVEMYFPGLVPGLVGALREMARHVQFTKDQFGDSVTAVDPVKVEFAWATTVHKAQGSEFDHVFVVNEATVFRSAARRWVYTALTRAAKKLTILGAP